MRRRTIGVLSLAVVLAAVFFLAPRIPLSRTYYIDISLDRSVSPSCALFGVGEVHAIVTQRGFQVSDYYTFSWNDSDTLSLIMRGYYHSG